MNIPTLWVAIRGSIKAFFLLQGKASFGERLSTVIG